MFSEQTGLTIFSILLIALIFGTQLPVMGAPDNTQAEGLGQMEPCEFKPSRKHAYDAECGTLTVPENRADPNSRMITLPVVRIPATGPNPAEPVFWLQGGPGSPNLGWIPPDWILEKHDVIEVGYRGTEGSVVLDCPNMTRLVKRNMTNHILGEEKRAELGQAAEQCAEDLRASGVDLSGYTVSEVITDMEVVRSALGYDRINLYGVSYGTRVAQLYAYMFPESLHRVVMVGLNAPGDFIWGRDEYDDLIGYMSDLCAADPACSNRTDDLAQTMYDINHDMPGRWLFFPIDADLIRIGTNLAFYSSRTMPLILDAYLAAGAGDPSGLAILTFIGQFMPFPQILGDQLSKGGTLDLEYYEGLDTINLADSIMGSPMSELLWPLASVWPIELEDESLRRLQESDVDMLIVNGTIDFSTPPNALDAVRPYYANAQYVLLAEFSHVGDVENLQPGAFERLVTSYYDTGIADDSLFEYQPLSFTPKLSLTTIARLVFGAIIVLPLLVIGGGILIVRRILRRQKINLSNSSSDQQKGILK